MNIHPCVLCCKIARTHFRQRAIRTWTSQVAKLQNEKAGRVVPAFSDARQTRRGLAYSQQGIVTSSQQSSQQGAAAKAAVEAREKYRTARSFLMEILDYCVKKNRRTVVTDSSTPHKEGCLLLEAHRTTFAPAKLIFVCKFALIGACTWTTCRTVLFFCRSAEYSLIRLPRATSGTYRNPGGQDTLVKIIID